MATAPPRVKLITIDGLFRQYNHVIPLRLDERVTVLHGRNGVGKTVTLRLVAALLRGEYETLATVPFERLRVDFDEGSYLSVGWEDISWGPVGTADVEAAGWDGFILEYRIGLMQPASVVLWDAPHVPSRLRARPRKSAPMPTYAPSLSLQSDRSSAWDLQEETTNPTPSEVVDFRHTLSVYLVEAQRLLRITKHEGETAQTSPAVSSAMSEISSEMAHKILHADSTYRSTSTRLDDSLPARLFAPPKNGSKVLKKELSQRSEALEAERRRLHAIGLLPDTTSFNPSTLTEAQRAMFIVYLKDNEEKLAVFKDLADRAEILFGTLNHKLAPKSIKLDKDLGYKVLSHDGRPLDLDALSSGEQHELVLLHTLLFRVEPGAFLLIDEPELSLHVTWQNEFLAELIQIAKKVGFDALVATHSPYIVGERRDLMVRLGEPV